MHWSSSCRDGRPDQLVAQVCRRAINHIALELRYNQLRAAGLADMAARHDCGSCEIPMRLRSRRKWEPMRH